MAPNFNNNLESCVASGQLCSSFGIKISSNAQVVQMARNAGFDSLFIDLEHGWLTLAEASNLCSVGHLSGITPFVRVPHQCGNGFVQRVLDGGAMGVVFPHIHNADDAKAAVRICKYPPFGSRSMMGNQPIFATRGISMQDTITFCNKSGSTVFVMIEGKDAVEAVDEIAAVDGVDVVLVGSSDLTVDMGIGGQFDSPLYRSSLERVSQACKARGKIFGVAGVYDSPEIQDWVINTLGARYMLVQQDTSLLVLGARQAVQSLPKVK
ncbi:unnamed protein product [Clonostachys rosea]|uniref:HpcH/HpaI aldolase/citrate lyase domain-containing protein n=1 Tax=Bionectria ochroleuca TaxID=29856 RepID=A0ABY6V041_BIOOC|nr:unnamed protein product [Clonostachys rosea]